MVTEDEIWAEDDGRYSAGVKHPINTHSDLQRRAQTRNRKTEYSWKRGDGSVKESIPILGNSASFVIVIAMRFLAYETDICTRRNQPDGS
jgi:hypothetical protein